MHAGSPSNKKIMMCLERPWVWRGWMQSIQGANTHEKRGLGTVPILMAIFQHTHGLVLPTGMGCLHTMVLASLTPASMSCMPSCWLSQCAISTKCLHTMVLANSTPASLSCMPSCWVSQCATPTKSLHTMVLASSTATFMSCTHSWWLCSVCYIN